jgi:hypothetical protein
MTEIQRLAKKIRDLHHVKAEHHASVPVHESFQDKTAWDGVVEVFRVSGNMHANFAYAWSYKDDNGKPRYIAVMGISPIDSAQAAVRVFGLTLLPRTIREADMEQDLKIDCPLSNENKKATALSEACEVNASALHRSS